MRWNPIASFFWFLSYLASGRLQFLRKDVGTQLTLPDGRTLTVFRSAVMRAGAGEPDRPGATFVVRFRVAGMSPGWNLRFSLLPIPFFIGLPGFRSKLWLVDSETGEFRGVYEWDTQEHAARYAGSFAMRFMSRRAVPGSVVHGTHLGGREQVLGVSQLRRPS